MTSGRECLPERLFPPSPPSPRPLQTAASASLPLPTPQTAATAAGLRVHVELPSSHLLLSSLGPLGHVTVTCPSASLRVGPAADKPPEQV